MSINDDDFNQITIPTRTYETESLDNEKKSINIEEGFLTNSICPFTIQANFSILGSITNVSSNVIDSQVVVTPDDFIGDILGFRSKVIHGEYNLSNYPVDFFCV